MKTIFITSFHPLVSRNVFNTGLLKKLSSKARVVIFVPDFKVEYFEKEFGGQNIFVEGIRNGKLSKLEIFFNWLFLALLNTKSMRLKRGETLNRTGNYFRYFLSILISFLFGNNRVIIKLSRFLDYNLLKNYTAFIDIVDNYKPDLIFSTDIQNKNDVALLELAKKRKIKKIGMVRSWDNLTCKGIIRLVPDKLIVASNILKKEAHRYSKIKKDKISVMGIPHYDNYLDPPEKSKKDFYKEMGFELDKKLVLLAPVGNRYVINNNTDKEILDILSEFDLNILVRLPPGDKVDLDGFRSRKAKVVIDETGTLVWPAGKKTSEMSRQDDLHLVESFYHADVIVTGPSTICIDAAVFNKPIIFINFDDKERKYSDSVSRYYDYNHIKEITKTKGVKLAGSSEELKFLVQLYLDSPSLDKNGRELIVKEQTYLMDGKATERLFKILQIYL